MDGGGKVAVGLPRIVLPSGLAANAAAVPALTLGAPEPGLAGPDLVDADADTHPA